MTVFDLDVETTRVRLPHGRPVRSRPAGHRFDATKILLDPYARAIGGRDVWGVAAGLEQRLPAPRRGSSSTTSTGRATARSRRRSKTWSSTRCTCAASPAHPSVGRAASRHLRRHSREDPVPQGAGRQLPRAAADLRVRRVREQPRPARRPASRCYNYWGYSTVGFFAPKAGYAATGKFGMQVDELKTLVKELHEHGIEVFLDVVFNHTAEGNEHGPDDLVPRPGQPDLLHAHARRATTTTSAAPATRSTATTRSCATWCSTACATGRPSTTSTASASTSRRSSAATRTARRCANPPLLESLAFDPILRQVQADRRGVGRRRAVPGRLASPPTAAGRSGTASTATRVRRFLKGDAGMVGEMATAPAWARPTSTAARGTTRVDQLHHLPRRLHPADLVSYNDKHNEANGENNNDGANDNDSWNCGVEGPTDDPAINALRRRQMKNAIAMLLVSQGVPMILMGDEVGRTQHGNNNAYCHDDELNWFDWGQVERGSGPAALHPALHRLPPGAPGAAPQPALHRARRGWLRLSRHQLARHRAWAAGLVGREPCPGLHALRAARRARRRRTTITSTSR